MRLYEKECGCTVLHLKLWQRDKSVLVTIGNEASKYSKNISKAVPKALSEVAMDAPVPWSENGDDYERVRQELLSLLEDPQQSHGK